MNELDPTTAALLVDHYREAEDLSDMGLSFRHGVGWILFEFMNQVGETRLRRTLSRFCPEISWEAATGAMRLVLVGGPEFWTAPPSWLNRMDSLSWLNDLYRHTEFLFNSGLLRRVKLGDRLRDLRSDVGETRLRRILTESCPGIPWEDAQSAMNWAGVVNHEFLESSCSPNFQGC